MPVSENRRKEAVHARHRSHKGCWTCKRKRIQCDETRPACQRCSKRGVVCEGYEIRLRWGAGIASRGRYSGAEKPSKEFIPPPSKRRWDLRAKGEQRDEGDQQGQPMVIFGSRVTEVKTLNEPVVFERPTVNILNIPYGENPEEYISINKHFELPVSTGSLGEGPDRKLQVKKGLGSDNFPDNMQRCSAIIA